MTAANEIVSVDPARPSVEVGRFRIEVGAVGAAVHAARAAFPTWSARTCYAHGQQSRFVTRSALRRC
jgi:acyl-CoA reductase-like NAD-dependent aldehyde dehydrogenase